MEGKCPVDHSSSDARSPKGSSGGCPVEHASNPLGGCPVDHNATPSTNSPLYNPAVNDMAFDQNRQSGQKVALSTERTVSTIPKGDFSPDHQPKDSGKWVYPSEQQYYNAMKRKGYNPSEADVPAVLYIHNVVNEQGWTKVKEWEAYCGNPNPKLKRFMGKPTQLSPKAWFLGLLGYAKPFDRHDWIVERSSGEEVRYVIDFYSGARTPQSRQAGKPVSLYLDVRPAADSVSAVVARLSFAVRQRFQPFSLPKWCLMGSPFFQAVNRDAESKNQNADRK